MPNAWFSNWGQVVQAVCVVVGTWLAIDRAYPDFKEDRLFTTGTLIAYVLVIVVVIAVARGIKALADGPSDEARGGFAPPDLAAASMEGEIGTLSKLTP